MFLLAACASTTVDVTDAATTARLEAFKSGNVVLPMGTIEAADWTLNRQAAYNLLAAGKWRELADLVQRKGINNDLNWYYLGRAAEGLGEIELARGFYQRSIERTRSEKYSHRCQGKVVSMCDGFDFPDVTQTRLGALKAAAPADAGGATEAQAGGNALLRTGTGFVVDTAGAVVTNYHVVQGCGAVSFLLIGNASSDATVIASDPVNDLALLKLREHPKSASVFQDPDKLRPGDDIIVFGYPLVGQLASAGNLTRGSVAALSGLRDDARYFQMSAPIQLGNSGGPVLNQAGRITGIVTYKLNAARELKTTGDISQNVNFALKTSVLRSFLDSNNITYARSNSVASPTAADVGSEAAKFTGIVGCYRN
ncbi:MAG: serine protease [Alphaproteobacteria bacterium]|nr:serine protease [Alphaproteobacteria bacterium]